ncbi:hypothetical protein BB2000_2564 [Proteus mirabilis BB2000]|nr:hypothetical protein BB2000_2564 [Proteus mirabilis BB2000]
MIFQLLAVFGIYFLPFYYQQVIVPLFTVIYP